jgi:hypothetical protein
MTATTAPLASNGLLANRSANQAAIRAHSHKATIVKLNAADVLTTAEAGKLLAPLIKPLPLAP